MNPMALNLAGSFSYCSWERECVKQRMRNIGTVVSGYIKEETTREVPKSYRTRSNPKNPFVDVTWIDVSYHVCEEMYTKRELT